MELGTFGLILRFAIEREERAARFYEAAAQGRLEGPFRELGAAGRKRVARLEQARREGVAEMILESISGLDGDAYAIDLTPAAGEAALLEQARALEASTARFYEDAAAKMPIREVVRLFQRLARENAQRRAQLIEHSQEVQRS